MMLLKIHLKEIYVEYYVIWNSEGDMINNYIPHNFTDPKDREYNNGNTIRYSKTLEHFMNEYKFTFDNIKQFDYTKITTCMEYDTFFTRYYPLLSELERDLTLFMHVEVLFDDSNIYIIDSNFAMLIMHNTYGYFIIAPREHEGSYDMTMWLKQ